jgi:2-polyprenyl-3-methyl-5-hydroxy-6-metoxy-1,4-benzoquinol methylase
MKKVKASIENLNPETRRIIQECLRFNGGRSRPDKTAPAILKALEGKHGMILDVGCGRGSFGRIIHAEYPNRFGVDGVEVHGEYQKDASRGGYRKIYRENYLETYFKRRGYQFYLFVDVLEHFDVKSAIKVVKTIQRLDKESTVLASIPNAPKYWKQDPDFENANPHEAHLFNWTDELVEAELGLKKIASPDGLGVYSNRP